MTSFYTVLGLVLTTIGLLMSVSPNNYYTSRRVFQAPLMTQSECQHVIKMAENAAMRNYEKYKQMKPLREADLEGMSEKDTYDSKRENRTREAVLMDPLGWQKTRHTSYPTTDLNVVTDPFFKEDRTWLADMLNRRLTPLLKRVYGLTSASIRANDMFVVRYDAERRAYLSNHTDDSDISFNVLLNDDFEGGGTRFWDRSTGEPFAHVNPKRPGQVLVHSALIHHEGYRITSGQRWILVGFLSVDRVDPFTGKTAGLSPYATYGSLAWMHTAFKKGLMIRTDRQAAAKDDTSALGTLESWLRKLCRQCAVIMQTTGDSFSHIDEDLVRPENAERYIEALDAHAAPSDSVWFKGQQIDLHMDGSIAGKWVNRQINENMFQEQEL